MCNDDAGDCFHTDKWDMSRMRLSHVTHAHTWMRHATHMNASCHTHECVMPHTWMRHMQPISEKMRLEMVVGLEIATQNEYDAVLFSNETSANLSGSFLTLSCNHHWVPLAIITKITQNQEWSLKITQYQDSSLKITQNQGKSLKIKNEFRKSLRIEYDPWKSLRIKNDFIAIIISGLVFAGTDCICHEDATIDTHIFMRQRIYTNESWHTYTWVKPRI